MTIPFILASSISIRIGEKFLFTGDSWTMNRGEHWAILGPNGSGKSTLAKALAGKLSVVRGAITLYFGDPSNEPFPISQKEYIGYLSFDTHRALVEKADKDAEAHSLMGKEYQGNELLQLSTGQMRRALIERTLARKPQLLILDEPFEGLDQDSKRLLIDFIDSDIMQNIQVILITHHLDELFPSISHVMLIKDGHIYKSGKRTEVLTHEHVSFLFSLKHKVNHVATMVPGKIIGETLIELSHVMVRMGEKNILNDINWTMKTGENWMIVGPNGAGKSTLMSLILGDHVQAFSNSIKIFGRKRGSGESIWDIKQHIGYISSNFHLDYREPITADKVVLSGFFDSIGLYRSASLKQKEIASEWFTRLQIEDLKNRNFMSLSLGQQRLILITRALVKSPRLLILDEPCHGLDIKNRERVLQIIDQSIQYHSNIIYITHHPQDILHSITHIMVLENGKIVRTLSL